MRLIERRLAPDLPIKWYPIYIARAGKLSALATQDLRSVYLRKNSSWGLLKRWLADASSQKCWYCEAKSTRAPFDVDHFRPKLGVTVDGTKLVSHDGYHWLAYEWWNFRLSCQRCNRPEYEEQVLYGKANEFPIQDETKRCVLPASDLDLEIPRLLDPCVGSDCKLLAHGLDGEVKPSAAIGTWDFDRADYTIKLLGFNEWSTPELKRGQWQTLSVIISLVGHAGDAQASIEIQKHLSAAHEYSSFFRSVIGIHRDKAWIQALI
ncbi:HNH endonuclease [Xanthomonas arboricola]|uniref:HNH endonuclease signature motif containing protein n=1 Tax=Xanthomonas TaxID=338 RepID=UPI0011125A81|nr:MULTISPECIES: HNH endonuclease signature motif containing protein [Xanthomonas]MBB3797586.1 hypothetical protein [Xanthomonas arboricola]MCC8670935.1 HNH endonuclease [Xanthomonas arboricola]